MNEFELITDNFPADIVLQELMNNWTLFGMMPIRTGFEGSPHREIEDILLRGPEDLEKSLVELHQEVDCFDYINTKGFSFTMNLAREFAEIAGGPLGRVLITKLPPGGKIYPHADQGLVAETYRRMHCVIRGGTGNVFTVNGNEQVMLTGEVWDVNVEGWHEVRNEGNRDRLHLLVDVIK